MFFYLSKKKYYNEITYLFIYLLSIKFLLYMVFFLIYFFLLKLIILESFHIIVSTFIGMNKTVGSLDFISFTFYDFFLEVNELRSCTTATVFFSVHNIRRRYYLIMCCIFCYAKLVSFIPYVIFLI